MARDAYIGHKTRVSQHLPSTQIIERAKRYIAEIKGNNAVRKIMTDRCQTIFDVCATFFIEYKVAY